MKPSLKEISLLLTLDTSSNLNKLAKDKMYVVTLRRTTLFSRSDFLTISWIKVGEISSLRLRGRMPRTLLDADLTASTTGSSVGEGIADKSWAYFMP